MPGKPMRKTNKTILLAAEGDSEFAFASHLRDCYVGRSCNVSIKIKNAHGAGPLGIVDALTSGVKGKSYDYLAALFDSDIDLCGTSSKFFRQKNVKLFQSAPSLEGTLLRVKEHRLRENVTTADCKRRLAKYYTGSSFEMRFYEKHFKKDHIDAARTRVAILDLLIKYLMDPDAYHNE